MYRKKLISLSQLKNWLRCCRYLRYVKLSLSLPLSHYGYQYQYNYLNRYHPHYRSPNVHVTCTCACVHVTCACVHFTCACVHVTCTCACVHVTCTCACVHPTQIHTCYLSSFPVVLWNSSRLRGKHFTELGKNERRYVARGKRNEGLLCCQGMNVYFDGGFWKEGKDEAKVILTP